MKVTLKLFASLRRYLPEGHNGVSCTLELSDGAKVEDVFNKLNIAENQPQIILVNGLFCGSDQDLKEADILSVFPPVAGG